IRKFIFMIFTLPCSLLLSTVILSASPTSDQLLNKFSSMQTSILNQRGLASGDLDSIRTLRDEFTTCNATDATIRSIAAELQLNIWLKDNDQTIALFERLSSMDPENSAIGLAWADFQLTQDDADPETIYTDLINNYPNAPEAVLAWVQHLDAKNRFTEGIKAIKNLSRDELASASVAEIYADLLYADNRFKEAVEVLEKIDQGELDINPAVSSKISTKIETYKGIEKRWDNETALREVEVAADDLPRATIITTKGLILVELFEDHAENTVANFINLVESGYYDGTKFHRVLPKFMIQGGDPNSREGSDGTPGSGGPGYTIADEHTGEDYREHFAGSLSMAKTSAPNSGGSQFFLTHLPTPHLDGRHTVFGKVLTGLDVVRVIEVNDEIVTISVSRKRDHDYTPVTIGGEKEANIKVPPTLSDNESE
ncbi:MAG: peptidylprolyl isomerase, partial [Planctomycetota bacterium]|nr:peptidylprolyl isomerase [Planctomycetota bacterium]